MRAKSNLAPTDPPGEKILILDFSQDAWELGPQTHRFPDSDVIMLVLLVCPGEIQLDREVSEVLHKDILSGEEGQPVLAGPSDCYRLH